MRGNPFWTDCYINHLVADNAGTATQSEEPMIATETVDIRIDNRVLYATLDAPPLNLIGPEIVRDLVNLVLYLEAHDDISVVLFRSANPEFFSAHVDMYRASELGAEISRLEPGAPLGALYRRISTLNQVSIAAISGRVRGAGSEFILACDMRFADERAVFGQPEVGVGAVPGAGALQHLTRLMGRGRALEALIGADDFTADLAAQYGWINRVIPAEKLQDFTSALAQRISRFPTTGIADAKQRVNAITLPDVQALLEDTQLFVAGLNRPETSTRIRQLFNAGMQTDGPLEAAFGARLDDLPPAN
jgi:enoyl-CoA hydratase/carnithine racemase